jgi:hypothetical protein
LKICTRMTRLLGRGAIYVMRNPDKLRNLRGDSVY